jgi:hypothetical protein
MTILCKDVVLNYTFVDAQDPKLRPLLGIELPGNRWVYTIHAPSGKPAFAKKTIISMLTQLGQGPWICVGDFNLDPGDVTDITRWNVEGSGEGTQQSGGELDFMVHSLSGVGGVTVTPLGTMSDHRALSFDVKAW